MLLALAGGLVLATLPWTVAPAAGVVLALVARSLPLGMGALRAAVVGAVVVMAGAFGHARVDGLERTALVTSSTRAVAGEATLLTGPRLEQQGGRRAVVRFHGERVLLRLPPWVHADALAIGDIVRVRGVLRGPDRAAVALDAQATWQAAVVAATGRRRGGLLGAIDGVRRRAQAAFSSGLPAAESALMAGMVLGQDDALPLDLRDDFRAAGLSHLVAASGQNIMLLVALALGASVALGLGFRLRWIVVLGLVALYVPLAGGSAPIERAGVAGSAMVAARLAGRPASRWYAILLSLVATLALDPRSLASPGWQLSFAAVGAIALAATPAASRLRARGVPRALAEVVSVSVVATAATAPVLAAHFGRVSLVAIPANVLAAPAVPPIMWIGMIASALAQVAAGVAATVAGLGALPLGYLTWLSARAAAIPHAQVTPVAGLLVTAALVVAAAWLLASCSSAERVRPSRRRGPLALLGLVAALLVCVPRLAARSAVPSLAEHDLRVTALDVGQGDATLLQVPGHAVLVDAGPDGTPLVSELRRAGVERLDALVITHPQADHEGGAPAVLRGLPVDLLLDGRGRDRSPASVALDTAIVSDQTHVVAAEAGRDLHAGPLSLQVLWPPPGPAMPGTDPNDRAVVAVASAFGSRALLTADAESPILAPLDLDPVDVLKVSHHGSADPGLPALLERLRPQVALIEVGRHNVYGHPAAPTMRALGATVPTVRRTDLDGSVRIDLINGRVMAVAGE